MASLIAWWMFLQTSTPEETRGGSAWGPFFWFWLAVMVVILGFFMARFARRSRPPPMGPR